MSFSQRSLAADRPALWRDPGPAVQPRAGCWHALARAVHLLHAPGRALPDVFRPGARGHGGACPGQRCADPVRRQRPRGGGGRARAARGLLQGLRHLGGRSRRRRSRPRPAPTTRTTFWRSPTTRLTRCRSRRCCRAFGSIGRSASTCSRRPRPSNPYQAWIDTYADEAFAAGRAQGDRDRRSDGAGGEPDHPRPDVPARSCAPPGWSGCSGTAPIAWSAGRSDRISGRRASTPPGALQLELARAGLVTIRHFWTRLFNREYISLVDRIRPGSAGNARLDPGVGPVVRARMTEPRETLPWRKWSRARPRCPRILSAGVNGHPSAWLETRLGMEKRRIRMTPDGPRRDCAVARRQGGHGPGAQSRRPLAAWSGERARHPIPDRRAERGAPAAGVRRLPHPPDQRPAFRRRAGARRGDRQRGRRRRGRPVRADRRFPGRRARPLHPDRDPRAACRAVPHRARGRWLPGHARQPRRCGHGRRRSSASGCAS